MKIGINMMLWTTFVDESHLEILSDLKKAGYDGVEIPLFTGDLDHYQKLRGLLDQVGLKCTTSTAGLVDKNLISPNPSIRKAGLEHLRWAVDASHVLGSEMLCGPFHSAPGVFSGEAPSEGELQWAVHGLKDMAQYAQTQQVSLSIEYLNRFESHLTNSLHQTSNIVEAVAEENLGIHYDTHHAHLEESDVYQAILNSGKHIHHVQYSESHRGVPGQGQVNWEATTQALKDIGYDKWVVVEAFTAKDKDIQKALHLWRPHYKDTREVFEAGISLIQRYWSPKEQLCC